MLRDDFVVYSAFGSRLGAGISLLVGRSHDAIVNVVFSGDGGRLLVADVAVKTFEIRTKTKVCGSVLGGVAIPFQGPSDGVTDPSACSECGLGPTSTWSEIGRKYKIR